MFKEFRGPTRWLSNFYESYFTYKNHMWKTTEHAYQALKTLDADEFLKVMNCRTPGQAKRLGQKVTLRKDWDLIKIKIMYDINYAKFSQNKRLTCLLIDTKDCELIEGNDWGDTFWGVCNGKGRNELGKILMRIRKEINPETK